jgi:putative MFS transporter
MESSPAFPATPAIDRATLLTIIVAALGYFVDIFDLLMFSIVRTPSLRGIGIADSDLLAKGIMLINVQMAGLLLGGIVWGMLGDRWGRKKVLFGSILLYSLANIANGYAQGMMSYSVLRFVAGIGLAGELGAGVTLASELLPRQWRGLGTTFIAFIGVLGATVAVFVAKMTDWRTAYIVGGCIGLVLLALRVNVRESTLHQKLMNEAPDVARGNILILLRDAKLLRRFLAVILVGSPIWGVIGLFITFTPEFAKDLGLVTAPTAGSAVLFSYIGNSAGAMFSGLLSQKLRSRKKSVAVSLALLVLALGIYVSIPYHDSLPLYYAVCGMLGFATGYWAMFVQIGAEQFGTNIRATAATSAPNFVRGLTIPITMSFHALTPHLGVTHSGVAVMAVLIALSFGALMTLRETFDAEMDFIEK